MYPTVIREGKEVDCNVSVVIPCYNEAKRLDCFSFRTYLMKSPSARLVFVDDGSKDNTVEVLGKICSGFEHRTFILRCEVNRGKAEAVRLGLLQALKEYNQEFVGYWDADLATPLPVIHCFVELLHARPDINMVFGSRIKLLGRHVKRDARRHYIGRIFATVVSNILELPIYDTQCGAKLFRVSSGLESILKEPFLSKWVFDVEIIARYRRAYGNDLKQLERMIYEYPLEWWEDVAGSKVRPSDFLIAIFDVLKIRSKYLKS
ncbi:MAG: glycosyltransferase [Acidobacteriaceae bacterium]|nr:glycosyltransferase [Acidobacteriaceae bacterium]